jgi:hypothetical protein
MGISFYVLLLFACSDQQDDSADAVVSANEPPPLAFETWFDEGVLLTEQISTCSSVSPLLAHQFLCRDEASVWFIDEGVQDHFFIGAHESAAAVHADMGVIMVLDGDAFVFDGADLEPLGLPVPVPVETMGSAGGATWMFGVGRLFRLGDGVLSELAVDGYPSIHDFAATDNQVHLAVPQLVSVSLADADPVVETMWDHPVTALAVDDSGDLWLVADEKLYLKRGGSEPVEVNMPEPVHDVVGPTIWIQGASSVYQFHDGGFTEYPLVAEGMIGVDDYGRLLQVREGQLRRHSADRPVVVTGLSESLMVAETVTLLPSDPDSLASLSVWVDDMALEVDEDPYQVTIDPERLAEGAHTLRFFAESAIGDSLTEYPVWVGELSDVGWSEIEALSQVHCLRCHGGETLTDLTTKEAWERHIETIIDVVTAQDMPLGGPYLSDEEITLIRAWKHGDFQ